MKKNPVVGLSILLLLFITASYPTSALAGHLVKDETGNLKVVEDEAGPSGRAVGSKPGDDRIWKDVLQIDSSNRKNYVEIVNEGIGYAQKGQYTQAIKMYEEAIRIEPGLSYAYLNFANAYWHLKKYEESIAMSKKALQIDPYDARIYENLGNTYRSSGKRKEARENYLKAEELFQKNGDMESVLRVNESLGKIRGI